MTDTDLEVCRVTAEACGKTVVYSEAGDVCTVDDGIAIYDENGLIIPWNPITTPEQRDECEDKLLELGYWFVEGTRLCHLQHMTEPDWIFNGPWRKFPARALAEVQRGKG